jgi:hypothetical protein
VESFAQRRLSGILAATILTTAVVGIALAKPGRVEQTGAFALVGGTPKIVSRFWVSHPNGLTGTLKVRQFAADGKTPILDYDVDMEHLMHMVIVRDDFTTFAHVHPEFDTQTGTFWQQFTKEPNHRYYVYADTTPHGLGQQVFRFTLDGSGPVANARPALSPSPRDAQAGPYVIRLSKTTLPANRAKNLNITVLRGGEPADDLVPYLGAAAHLVFINTSTLSYIHVHPMLRSEKSDQESPTNTPMGMSGKAGPFMQTTLPPLPAGYYKVWIQIMGGGDNVYTAPFTILSH